MRRIVADTGPVLHLVEVEALDLLQLAGEVCIPPAVDAELAQHLPDWPIQRPDWLIVASVEAPHREQAESWRQAGLLHAGEAEAIGLARQRGADWLLTDDAAARLFAGALGLEVHGSLGVILWAAAAGHLDQTEAEAVLERLAHSSLWVSPAVLEDARAALLRLCGSP